MPVIVASTTSFQKNMMSTLNLLTRGDLRDACSKKLLVKLGDDTGHIASIDITSLTFE